MSLLIIMTMLALAGAIAERPKKIKAYRKRSMCSFELNPQRRVW